MNGQKTHQTLYKFWKHFILATSFHPADVSDDHHIVILLNWPHLNLGIFTRTKCISSGLPEPITTTYIFGNLKVWATNLLIRVLSYFKRQYCSRFWHTWHLSFFLHEQKFWRIKFTPKKRVSYDKIHRKLPIFCVITAKYTVNCQFFALNL